MNGASRSISRAQATAYDVTCVRKSELASLSLSFSMYVCMNMISVWKYQKKHMHWSDNKM